MIPFSPATESDQVKDIVRWSMVRHEPIRSFEVMPNFVVVVVIVDMPRGKTYACSKTFMDVDALEYDEASELHPWPR
jgi:hypothetical protein